MKYVAVDVGLINFSLVGATLPENYLMRETVLEESDIKICMKIDITALIYSCDDDNCKLHHEHVISDYMSHLFKKYGNIFEEADVILVERQPITGICAVQELILSNYRDKTTLVSPNAMLNFFGILHIPYDDRKPLTVEIARKYLCNFEEFQTNKRRHDMADAVCILYYYINCARVKYNDEITEKELSDKLTKNFGKAVVSMKKFEYVNF